MYVCCNNGLGSIKPSKLTSMSEPLPFIILSTTVVFFSLDETLCNDDVTLGNDDVTMM